MKEFQGKREIKKVLYSKPFVLFLLVVILFMVHSVWQIGRRSQTVRVERQSIAAQVTEFAERKKSLEGELAALKTDRGMEEAIRQKFSVVKEGESVVTVVASTTTVASTTLSWWQRLFSK